MKSLVWEAPRSMVSAETPMPTAQGRGGDPGSLRGRLRLGTERLSGPQQLACATLVMGHEFSGERLWRWASRQPPSTPPWPWAQM